jgi:ABC-type multidrug transport system fused ATPase/permease subunit
MRQLPLTHPGTADSRSPHRYLWWVARGQWTTLAGAVAFGVVWMVAQALMPAIIGRAIDAGVAVRDTDALLWWGGLLLAVGVVQAVAGIMRHRFAVTCWLIAAYRSVQLVARRTTELGATLPKRIATGEVVSVGATDLAHIGNTFDVLGRLAGAVVSFLVVAVLLLNTSVALGLVVLLGVPVLLVAIGPLLRPLQQRNLAHRDLMGGLNTLAGDIVAGLRVLRGIGGEQVFHRRYVRESQHVRGAGVEVGRLQSVLDGLQVLLPGVFIVVVVWLGARFAVQGSITPGELVAFYGYAAFLMLPLRTATEFANKYIRAVVAARRICRVLDLTNEVADPDEPAREPGTGALVDHDSGVTVAPGRLTALVCAQPEVAAGIADRLGGYAPRSAGSVTLAGVPLSSLPRAVVRRRILVSDPGATLFSGVLRDQLAAGRPAEQLALARAVHTAAAEDVLEALPGGLDAPVDERGRSFSGGQRQRLTLARALTSDPDVLVLVEPTSAVDAHTEARVARRLAAHRAGRTTLVVTASPLLLEHVDHVLFVEDGRVVAGGRHRDLLGAHEGYRRTVTRGAED